MTKSAAKMAPTLFISNLPFGKRRNIICAFSLRYKSTEKTFRMLKHPAKVFYRRYPVEKITQTTGRDMLGDFSPMFAHLNDDVLFGEVWNESAIDVKTKCIVTVVALIASGITDTSLSYHLQNAKKHDVTKAEIAAVITHTAMYTG